MKNRENTYKNECFYCRHCHRIKPHGICLDFYCVYYHDLTDAIEECNAYDGITHHEKGSKLFFDFDTLFNDQKSGVSFGGKEFTIGDLYQMIIEMQFDINALEKERVTILHYLWEMANKHDDPEYLYRMIDKTDKAKTQADYRPVSRDEYYN